MRLLGSGNKLDWKHALGEVALIVIGVTIAMAAGSWYEDRLDMKDEQLFLSRLHNDLAFGDELASRVRDRRVNTLDTLIAASDVLLVKTGRAELNDAECNAVAGSHFTHVNISDLPSLTELASTGRMTIIQDGDLRTALVGLQQISGTFPPLVSQTRAVSIDLARDYPGMIRRALYIEQDTGEVRLSAQCDTAKIRANAAFINDFIVNVDQYDVYVRDGLAPWIRQFELVHDLTDKALGIRHD